MGNVQFAGFWRRVVALILDGLIWGVPVFLLKFMLVGKDMGTPLGQLVSAAIGIVYSVYFLTSGWQATPGKRILSIYVISQQNGGRLDVPTAILRYGVLNAGSLLLVVLMVCLPDIFYVHPGADAGNTLSPAYRTLLGLGGIYGVVIAVMVGLTNQKTGLHDLIAKTRVIHGRPVV